MTIDERARAMVVRLEGSGNLADGHGPRCPMCGGMFEAGRMRHVDVGGGGEGCDLGRLCDDLRTIALAAALESGTVPR